MLRHECCLGPDHTYLVRTFTLSPSSRIINAIMEHSVITKSRAMSSLLCKYSLVRVLNTFLAPIGAQERLMLVSQLVRSSVQTCLEQSIFIILAQIFKQSVRNKSAVSEHSESTQKALRKHSESTQKALREQSEHQNKSQYSRSI